MDASLSIVDTFLLAYPWLEEDERLVGIGQGVSGPGFETGPGIMILCEVGAKADLQSLIAATWEGRPVVIEESGHFELDSQGYEELEARLTDPATEVRSGGVVLTGAAAGQEGSRLLTEDGAVITRAHLSHLPPPREYGSDDELDLS